MTENNKNLVLNIEAENGIINDVATMSINNSDAYPNTSATAVALSLNSWGAGSFSCPDDAVWFKFTPSTTKYYTIRSDGSLDVMAQLYNNSNILLNQADDEGPGMNFRMVEQLTAGQTYYIKVTAFGTVGAFNIIVSDFVYVESVTINPEYITLNNGSSTNLTATVAPSYATNKNVFWQSGNTNVAKVDSNGKVTAVGGGETCICAYSQDGSNKYSCCEVFVPVAVQELRLGYESFSLDAGETEVIDYAVLPQDATNKSVTWCSSNPNVVEINASTGLMTAKMAGTAIITGTTMDGSFSDSCTVTINYCGGSDYRNVTKHAMVLQSDGYYVCSTCGYRIKSPELQDKDILSTDDYLKIITVMSYYAHNVLLAKENPSSAYFFNEEARRCKIFIDTIRSKNQYSALYQYQGANHRYLADETDETIASFVMKSAIDEFTIGSYNGFYETIATVVIGYFCPPLAAMIDIVNLVDDMVEGKIDAISFSALIAGLAGMDEIALALSFFSASSDIIDCDVLIGDPVVRISFNAYAYVECVFDVNGNIKRESINYTV